MNKELKELIKTKENELCHRAQWYITEAIIEIFRKGEDEVLRADLETRVSFLISNGYKPKQVEKFLTGKHLPKPVYFKARSLEEEPVGEASVWAKGVARLEKDEKGIYDEVWDIYFYDHKREVMGVVYECFEASGYILRVYYGGGKYEELHPNHKEVSELISMAQSEGEEKQ